MYYNRLLIRAYQPSPEQSHITKYLPCCLPAGVGRLEDETPTVIKAGLHLLYSMVRNNPFGPQLDTPRFVATLQLYEQKLKELVPPEADDNDAGGDDQTGGDNSSSGPQWETGTIQVTDNVSYVVGQRHVMNPVSLGDGHLVS